MVSQFESLRYYNPDEVQPILKRYAKHPMMKALLKFSFPKMGRIEATKLLQDINSIEEFQEKIIYQSISKLLEMSSTGLTVSGHENLDPKQAYLYISNHRDILLDTSLINLVLLENGLGLTASAIGDNLVQRDIFMVLAKLNRNFLVKRDTSPRDLLVSSKLLSEYIEFLISEKKQSVWIAQREGRAKDGHDMTHPGVLKMLCMASKTQTACDYLKGLKVVPVSISYEFDPTDKLKAKKAYRQTIESGTAKHKNEDFNNIMAGAIGQKRRIHIHFGEILDQDLSTIANETDNSNKQIQQIAKVVDREIISNFKLYPNNFIAYDLLHKSKEFESKYTEKEKAFFIRRMELSIDKNIPELVQLFLEMYANPIVNKKNLNVTL